MRVQNRAGQRDDRKEHVGSYRGGTRAVGDKPAGASRSYKGKSVGAKPFPDKSARRDRSVRREGPTRGVRRPDREAVRAQEEAADEFIIGRRAIAEALKSGRSLNKLLVQEGAEGGSLGEILGMARDCGLVVQRVPKVKIDEVARNHSHQGVLAYVSAKPYVELDDLILKASKSRPGLLVLLEGVEDPHNLGSVLRSVDGAGATGVIIPKRRAAPLTGTVAKSSSGALEHVDVARIGNVSQALDKLKDAGFWIVGADERAESLYWEVDLTAPTVLVIGNEGRGVSRLTQERCDMLVKLPMRGQINSLNAGVATGILLYEAVKQRSRMS